MVGITEDIGKIWSQVKPLVKAAGTYLSYKEQAGNQEDAANQYNDSMIQAANLLKGGYDTQLDETNKGISEMARLLDTSYGAMGDILTGSNAQYGEDIIRAAGNYERMLSPQVDDYGNRVMDTAEQYGQNIFDTANVTNNILDQYSDQYGNYYQPYMDAGGEALDSLRTTAFKVPSELTPAQQIALEDYNRNALATLAASGLRGAGRAGVASVNDGARRMMADFYDQNQRRSDNAVSTLSTQGYGATGNVATNAMNVGRSKGDIAYKTGADAAGKLYTTGTNVAQTVLNNAKDAAGKYLSAFGDKAAKDLQLGKTQADLTGKYYGGQSDLSATKSQAAGDTAVRKAIADASALQTGAGTTYNTQNANAQNWGQTLGQIASQINSSNKATTQKNTSSGAPVPWKDPDSGQWLVNS